MLRGRLAMNEKEKAICTLQNDIAQKQEQIRFILNYSRQYKRAQNLP